MKGDNKMLNEGLNRDAVSAKVMGAVCALAAVAGLLMIFFGGGLAQLVIAVANGALAFICFMENENEKYFFVGALGIIILAEVIGIFTNGLGGSSAVFNSLISIAAHFAMIAYIMWNRVTRNQVILAGAMLVLDVLWRVWMFSASMKSLGGLYGMMGGDATELSRLTTLAVVTALLTIVPAASVTVLLFTGALDYGN